MKGVVKSASDATHSPPEGGVADRETQKARSLGSLRPSSRIVVGKGGSFGSAKPTVSAVGWCFFSSWKYLQASQRSVNCALVAC